MEKERFDWSYEKDILNQQKHGVTFRQSVKAFDDKNRIILKDLKHSYKEQRFFCIGKVKSAVITVRFTYRGHNIRIFGAACWRKEQKIYEKKYKK